MSEQKNLKFIHLGSTAAAKDGSFEAGAIIFEPKSGRIAVQGTTAGPAGLEYYGGGRIADAKFENKILTLSFNDGSDAITLDFSDTASASGVNAILGGLNDRITSLETTVNGADGLVNKVTANTTAIGVNTAAIANINNESTGILAKAKKYTDDEIVELRGGADGYKGTLKGLDDAIKSNDADITNLQDLHANKTGESGKMKVIDEINAKVGEINTNTVKEYVDGKVTEINGAAEDLGTRIGALETTVGNASSGLVQQVNDNEAKLNTLIGADTGKSARTIANEELAAQLIPENAKESLDTLQEIAAWIQKHPDDASAMNTAIENLQKSVGNTGDTANANGSVYARIAKNAADITTNATAISDNAKAIRDNDTDIAALQALHAKDGEKMVSVATEVAAGIKGLSTVTKTNDEGNPKTADVVVTVTTTEGKVSAVGVDASKLRGAVNANTNAITAEVTRAKGEEEGLRNDLGTKLETEGDAFTRIKALEAAQASGSLMWSVWD